METRQGKVGSGPLSPHRISLSTPPPPKRFHLLTFPPFPEASLSFSILPLLPPLPLPLHVSHLYIIWPSRWPGPAPLAIKHRLPRRATDKPTPATPPAENNLRGRANQRGYFITGTSQLAGNFITLLPN